MHILTYVAFLIAMVVNYLWIVQGLLLGTILSTVKAGCSAQRVFSIESVIDTHRLSLRRRHVGVVGNEV
jgi:hypothetical protein